MWFQVHLSSYNSSLNCVAYYSIILQLLFWSPGGQWTSSNWATARSSCCWTPQNLRTLACGCRHLQHPASPSAFLSRRRVLRIAGPDRNWKSPWCWTLSGRQPGPSCDGTDANFDLSSTAFGGRWLSSTSRPVLEGRWISGSRGCVRARGWMWLDERIQQNGTRSVSATGDKRWQIRSTATNLRRRWTTLGLRETLHRVAVNAIDTVTPVDYFTLVIPGCIAVYFYRQTDRLVDERTVGLYTAGGRGQGAPEPL